MVNIYGCQLVTWKALIVFFLYFGVTTCCYARYVKIPERLDTCANCHGMRVNPNYCRECHGMGFSKPQNSNGMSGKAYYCRACAGGLPYVCSYCDKNGFVDIVELCFRKEKEYVPLWNDLGALEDFYFVGNAVIQTDTCLINIVGHKLQSLRKNFNKDSSRKYVSISYDEDSCMAREFGTIGMLDYERTYQLRTFRIGRIKSSYVIEPWRETLGKIKEYTVKYENDSTYVADLRYVVTPSHIVCGSEEFFFKNGILVKKISPQGTEIYKYRKFDKRNNWIERDRIIESRSLVVRQKRTIKYL